ncbi:MAG: carboxypeptidase-like regulatory domain-containing protein [Terracidiphilus sp.]
MVDVSGTTVPGASIEILKPGRGFTRELTADADGRFRVEEVPSGYVSVSAEMKGFKKLVLARVLVPGGKTKHIKLNPNVGNSDEVIPVNVNE